MVIFLRRIAILILLLNTVSRTYAESWRQWGGPQGQGVSTATAIPLRWSDSENVKWKTEIRGRGWSSPVMDDKLIWITTAETKPATEEERAARRAQITNRQPVQIAASVTMSVLAIDRETGEKVHDVDVLTEAWPQAIHATNSYATPSPVLADSRLYCHFGTHGTVCLDASNATVIWKNDTVKLEHENGPGSTPIVYQDLLIFHCDGTDTQAVTALHKETGEVVWRTQRSGELHPNPQLRKAYATPIIVDAGNGDQLYSPGADWLYAYDPLTGKELWKLPYGELGFSNSARPLFQDGRLFVNTGFMKARLLAVDIPPKVDEPRIAWTLKKQVGNVSSPVIVDDMIFVISDGGVGTCLDVMSGEVHWQKRIGGSHWSSPLAVDGHVVFSNREGGSAVVKASKEFELVAENKLPGSIMATLTAVDHSLFIRTDQALYCVENGEP